jgi:hypothetical protein
LIETAKTGDIDTFKDLLQSSDINLNVKDKVTTTIIIQQTVVVNIFNSFK